MKKWIVQTKDNKSYEANTVKLNENRTLIIDEILFVPIENVSYWGLIEEGGVINEKKQESNSK